MKGPTFGVHSNVSIANTLARRFARLTSPKLSETSEFAWNWNRSGEPDGLSRHDFVEDRLSWLIRLALEGGHISIGRAAEILEITREDMREQARGWAR